MDKLEFLVIKSQELLNKQRDSYKDKRTMAASIIGIIALFIPLFLSGMNDAFDFIWVIAFVPIGLMCWASYLLLTIMLTQPLDFGFDTHKFQDLVNKEYKEVLVYEMGANISSFKDNSVKTEKQNSKYNLAVRITIIAIFFSIGLLLVNSFCKPEKNDNPKIELKIN